MARYYCPNDGSKLVESRSDKSVYTLYYICLYCDFKYRVPEVPARAYKYRLCGGAKQTS